MSGILILRTRGDEYRYTKIRKGMLDRDPYIFEESRVFYSVEEVEEDISLVEGVSSVETIDRSGLDFQEFLIHGSTNFMER